MTYQTSRTIMLPRLTAADRPSHSLLAK